MDKKMWPFFAFLFHFLITSVFCGVIIQFSIQYKIPVRYWLLGSMWVLELILYTIIWVNGEREINKKFYQDSTTHKK